MYNNKAVCFFKKTYANIIFLIGDFFYSLIFVFIIAGLIAGFGLVICWVGIPIVILLFDMFRYFTKKEIEFAVNFVPVTIKVPEIPGHTSRNILIKFKQYVRDGNLWKYSVFQIIKFPVSIITFSLCIILVTASFSLLATPLLYRYILYQFIFIRINTILQAVMVSIIGVVLTIITGKVLNWSALLQGNLIKKFIEENTYS